MQICFDVDTALSEVPVNIFPLTDDTDFKTRETAIAYNAAGMALVWNFVTTGGAYTQTAVTPTNGGSYDWAHQGGAMYSIEIPASGGASINNDSEGFGWFTGYCTGVLPWRSPIFCFRAAGINDKLIDDAYSTTRGLAGTALPAAAADAAGGLPVSDAGGLDIDTLIGRLDAAITSRSTLTAQQVWEYATRTLSAFGFSVTVGTNNDKTGYTLTVTPPTASDISTAVWGAETKALTDKAGFTLSGTKTTLDSLNDVSAATVRTQVDNGLTAYDAPTKAELDSAVSPLALQSTLTTVASYVDTEVSSIKAVTDKLDTAMVLDGAVYQFTTNALENAPSGGGGGDATLANQTIMINHLTDIKGATFSGTTDSLEAIRDRGDAAWVTGGGLSGSNTALITVQDGSGNNIVDAYVDIFDSGNTSFQQRFITNSSGQVTFSINDGTWYIRILKSGYTFTAVSFIVSGNYTHTYNMTPYVITPPSSPDLCRVYTYVYKPDGTFHTTLSGIATIGVYTEDNQYYTYQSTAVYSNTTGLIYWDIKQGASAVLTITELEYFTKSILVPSMATSELSDL